MERVPRHDRRRIVPAQNHAPRNDRNVLAAAVEFVADERKARAAEMHAYLVLAAGVRACAYECKVAERFEDFVRRAGRRAVLARSPADALRPTRSGPTGINSCTG